MATPLRVLFIEDSTDDVNLILGELRRGGYEPSFTIAATWPALEAALDGPWEIAVIGDPLAGIDLWSVITRLCELELPGFVVSKAPVRERIAALRRAGAREAMALDDLVRLVPAIRREMCWIEERLARRQAKQWMLGGESILTAIFAGIRDGLSIIDRDFNIIRVNPAMEQSHAARVPLVGKKCYQVFQDRTERCEFCPCLKTMETGEPAEGLVPRPASGQGAGWAAIYAFPLLNQETGRVDGILECIRDVTERKRAEEALTAERELQYELARERDLLHTLMDNSPDSIYFQDEACRYTRVNAATARIMGLDDPREAIGKTVFDFLPEETAQSTYQDEQRIIQTGQPLINKIERLSRGGTRWVLTTKVPTRDQDGNVTGIVGISRDITERKRAEEELTQSFDRLRRSMEGAIQAMALTVEIRDPYTAGHQRRVAQLAHAIAKEMGLPGGQIDGIRLAAAIHDVGKIYIPAEILSKPGRITETEFSLIRTHPQVGHDILKIIEFPWPISLIVLQHHKRMDGSGYPPTTPREEILLEARILSVADVVEAMSSHRPYRPALGIEKALREISMNSGLLYDPRVVAICLRLFTDKGFAFE